MKNVQNAQQAQPTPPGGRKIGMEVTQDPSIQRGFNFPDFELIKVIGRGSYAKVISFIQGNLNPLNLESGILWVRHPYNIPVYLYVKRMHSKAR